MAFCGSAWSSLKGQCKELRSTFSSWIQLLQGIPQGSVLDRILFNTYIRSSDIYIYIYIYIYI